MASGHQAVADQGAQELQEVTIQPVTPVAPPLIAATATTTTRDILAQNSLMLGQIEKQGADLLQSTEHQVVFIKGLSDILTRNKSVLGQFQEALMQTIGSVVESHNTMLEQLATHSAQLLFSKDMQSTNTKITSELLAINNSAFGELERENAQLRERFSSLEERLQEVNRRLANHNLAHERQLQESGTRMQLLEQLAQESLGSQACQRRTERLGRRQAVETCTEAPERFGPPGSQLHGSGSALKQRKQVFDHCAEVQTSEQSSKRQRPEALEPEIQSNCRHSMSSCSSRKTELQS